MSTLESLWSDPNPWVLAAGTALFGVAFWRYLGPWMDRLFASTSSVWRFMRNRKLEKKKAFESLLKSEIEARIYLTARVGRSVATAIMIVSVPITGLSSLVVLQVEDLASRRAFFSVLLIGFVICLGAGSAMHRFHDVMRSCVANSEALRSWIKEYNPAGYG